MGRGEQKWRLPITLSLTILGVIILLVGVVALLVDGAYRFGIVAVIGLALVAYFAPLAAGARRSKIGTGLVKSESDFSAPPPPQQPRSYLPKGKGSNPKRK